jgi:2-dehydro-3-deoxyphosphogalactonate aldolase
MTDLTAHLEAFPLVAILRGVRPEEAEAIGDVLVQQGFRIIEVPLNSPDPFTSIGRLARRFPDVMIGAGTVLDPADADRVHDAGGKLVVMPHSDGAVIRRAKALGMACAPGVATPTEAFAALAAGADALKLFPAEGLPPAVMRAWLAVLPKGTALIPVGGITPANMDPYWAAGASGFGLGSALYKPGMTATEVDKTARAFANAVAKRAN